MIAEIDPASAVPAFEQLRAQIAGLIALGSLPEGTRLPPIRQLAADLGLAPGTVARAYRELENAGLVSSRVRHGTVVAPSPSISRTQAQSRLAEAARAYAAVVRSLGISREQAIAALDAQTAN